MTSETEEGGRNPPDAKLEELRDLLLAPEKKQISDLRERLGDPSIYSEELSQVLPAAVRLATSRNGQLASALVPSIESTLKESVRRDPSTLADAIFPVIGPAIRKAIADAMRQLLESLNQTLEHTVSAQAFKWRLEAMRTGKSFAEVVILRTLVYRVEQVFLIHKETGLLLQHVHRLDDAAGGNADMVSGMFTAIQDFARDSFGVSQGHALETMQVGELNVWLEPSPRMTLAAVIRGVAPQDYRTVLATTLERIHSEQQRTIESFAGDPAPFEVVRPYLEDCLRLQRAERSEKKRSRLIWIIALLLLAGGIAWGAIAVHRRAQQVILDQQRQAAASAALAEEQRLGAAAELEKQHRAREAEDAQWDGFVQSLKSREGIVVTESVRRDGKWQLAGLRDPLSIDPATLIAESGIDPARVVMSWQPYQALTPGLVLERATRRLRPPATATLHLRDDVLTVEGSASGAWIAAANRIAPSLPGVATFETAGLRDETATFIAAKKNAIENTTIKFDHGVAAPAPNQEAEFDRLAQQIEELRRATTDIGRSLLVSVKGHTTVEGTDTFNLKLSRERAEAVRALLTARSVLPANVVAIPVGTRETPTGPEATLNRRVTFQVTIGAGPLTP